MINAIGKRNLKDNELGKTCICPNCEEVHKVIFDPDSKLQSVKCDGFHHLVGLEGIKV